jgi:hypothetical protein
MNYLDRTKLELSNIAQSDDELTIRLQESGIADPTTDYSPTSSADRKAVYMAVLSILESIANDPQQMRTIKEEDQSISDIAANLQNRIDQLERKIRMINSNDSDGNNDSSYFNLFRD